MLRGSVPAFALAILLVPVPGGAAEARIELTVEPLEATVGDPLNTTLVVPLEEGEEVEPTRIGPSLGPFTVLGGSWGEREESVEGPARRVWQGRLAAYETGSLSLPPIRVRIFGAGGETELSSEPLPIEIASVLSEEERADPSAEIADLKPPASVPPNYRPLWLALGALALLLFAAAVAWWLHRRYGARLAAVEAPVDPFHRVAPHVWVYAELQRLLEQRLPEQGEIERFFDELARILKLYLGGRFRLDLLEQTTAEVPVALAQTGAGGEATEAARQLLESCDAVKFARHRPDPAACRAAVEAVYRIVDATKPADVSATDGAQRGAA
jgi:hypothetical protein